MVIMLALTSPSTAPRRDEAQGKAHLLKVSVQFRMRRAKKLRKHLCLAAIGLMISAVPSARFDVAKLSGKELDFGHTGVGRSCLDDTFLSLGARATESPFKVKYLNSTMTDTYCKPNRPLQTATCGHPTCLEVASSPHQAEHEGFQSSSKQAEIGLLQPGSTANDETSCPHPSAFARLYHCVGVP